MKAAVVEKPGVLAVRAFPEPAPGEYDALCELLYGATCTGTDSHILAGTLPFAGPCPTVLGHESVGRVIALGRKVRNYRVGDLVTRVGMPPPADGSASVTWGGFAEFGLARDHWAMQADGRPESEWRGAQVNQVLPAAVDPRVAPLFTTWRETLSYMLRMNVSAGARVLVAGSGGNGLAFANHAIHLGCSKVALVGAVRLASAVVENLPSLHYFDYARSDLTDAVKQAFPDGFDFIIDAVGKQTVADALLPCLRGGGVYGIYGIDEMDIALKSDCVPGGFRIHACAYHEAETHQAISDLVLQKRLAPGLWYDIEKPYALDDIAAAFADLRERRGVKALIRLTS